MSKLRQNYVGQTKRLRNTRKKERKNNFFYNLKNYNVISKRLKDNSDHKINWENVKILHKEKNYRKRSIAEMIHIEKQRTN